MFPEVAALRIALRASPQPSRRAILAGLAGVGLALAEAGRLSARSVENLEILGAPTGASITLARVVDAGMLAAAPNATFRLWRDPDQLRAGVASGRTRLFSTPTNLPANLANRSLPIKLLCLLGQGHLSVVTADQSVNSLKDLVGKPVLCFFRNDMPDLVFRACAHLEGIDPDKDIKLTYVQTGMEAAQMLAAGKADSALLPEPAATAAIMMAAGQGRILRRAVSLQQIWAAHHGHAGIPMVGVAVHQSLIDEDPDIIAELGASLPAAKSWVLANRAEAAALAEKDMSMHREVFEKAIDHFNMEIISAYDARDQLETFYKAILDLAPDALGGKLPPDDFYLKL